MTQDIVIALIIAAIFVSLTGISLLFFRLGREFVLKKRIASSVHGLALALFILYGLFIEIAGLTGASPLLQLPPLPLLPVCIGSMIYSCWLLRPRWPFLLLHLLTLVLFMPALYWVGISVVGWT